MSVMVTWEAKGVWWKFFGALQTSEIYENTLKIASSPASDSLRYVLVDYSNVDVLHVDYNDMDMIAAQSIGAAVSNAQYVVIVVTASPELVEMTNYYKELVKPLPVLIFENISDARKWIGENIH